MDIVDRTDKDSDILNNSKIKEISDKADQREIEETGYCLYCGEELEKGRRWCDAACRDAWEKERRQHHYKY